MKKELLPSLILTFVCIILFSGVYPLVMWGIAQVAPNKGEGFVTKDAAGKNYYSNIAQSFTKDNYFWPRPSAVGYAANGSGGSNKGPDNPDFLKQVQDRIDSLLAHDPDIRRSDIPVDLITASGSGLDPHISVQAAKVQVLRVAKARGLPPERVEALVTGHIEQPMMGMGPERVNVLQLNLDLDKMK